ncbi:MULTISPECIES: RnfH family protein [unclassified Polynucleobacter]|uniref:RnfH family protein n=1 Tax=unclassified Polynucleobacter TaxID=2640945 RepID=UPI001BFE34AE|nr:MULTISPECIES: RnfH family protein [unclassified Polynucleobacter]MBU3606333.1 RnfH family protein [Polynucleobacter sp. MWH-Creno-3A4]QWD78483.1 RnfH family protein [Polynucleobacter sp. MWH-Svant-W18]
MAKQTLDLLLCDARQGEPVMRPIQLQMNEDELPTVGLALVHAGIATGEDDPVLSRKGSFGVFGKRKDWDSPIYSGDRLELYSPLLIDPKTVRRKKANQSQDAKFQAAAAKRKARRL